MLLIFAVIAFLAGGIMGLFALGTYQLWLLIALFLLFFVISSWDMYWIVSIVAVTWAFIAMFGFTTFVYLWIFIIGCLFFSYLLGELN